MRKLVTTYWRESDAGPPRRYYALTADGRSALDGFVLDYLARLETAAAPLPPVSISRSN